MTIRSRLVSSLRTPIIQKGVINRDLDLATKICWKELPRVSRSFALVIQNLPRGLDKDEATQALTRAFASAILGKLAIEECREYLATAMDEQLDALIDEE